MPGVVAVTELPSGVAVTAKTFDQALKAGLEVQVTWGPGTVDGVSDADIKGRLAAAIPPMTPAPPLTQRVDATFSFAFVNHAPMEVGSAVADVQSGSAEVWVATKSPTGAQSAVAEAVGLSAEEVTLHVIRGGGSFGRRIYHEPAVEAARVSQAIGKPVKLMWTRNDDMRHGRVRPRSHHQLRAVHAAGEVLSYEHRMSCVELDLGSGTGQALVDAGYVSPTIGTAFFSLSQSCRTTSESSPKASPRSLTTCRPLRGVRSTRPRLARLRRSSLMRSQRRWESTRSPCGGSSSKPPMLAPYSTRWRPKGSGAGQCRLGPRKAWPCMPVPVDRGMPGRDQLQRAEAAGHQSRDGLGRGAPGESSGLRAQAMGSLMDGISTVLLAGNHLDDGAFREGSYSDFKYARQADAPLTCEVHLLAGTGKPGGVGELCVPAAAGAVANAYARATGDKPRTFPINFEEHPVPSYAFKLNEENIKVDAPADMPLLWVLRDLLGVTGPKYGCGVGVCRACTCHVNGSAVQVCMLTAADVVGRRSPRSKAWLKEVACTRYRRRGSTKT